jgi:hypothetical protein
MKTSTPKEWTRKYRDTARKAGCDRALARYDPPGGTGYLPHIERQVLGTTMKQRIYDKLYRRK